MSWFLPSKKQSSDHTQEPANLLNMGSVAGVLSNLTPQRKDWISHFPRSSQQLAWLRPTFMRLNSQGEEEVTHSEYSLNSLVSATSSHHDTVEENPLPKISALLAVNKMPILTCARDLCKSQQREISIASPKTSRCNIIASCDTTSVILRNLQKSCFVSSTQLDSHSMSSTSISVRTTRKKDLRTAENIPKEGLRTAEDIPKAAESNSTSVVPYKPSTNIFSVHINNVTSGTNITIRSPSVSAHSVIVNTIQGSPCLSSAPKTPAVLLSTNCAVRTAANSTNMREASKWNAAADGHSVMREAGPSQSKKAGRRRPRPSQKKRRRVKQQEGASSEDRAFTVRISTSVCNNTNSPIKLPVQHATAAHPEDTSNRCDLQQSLSISFLVNPQDDDSDAGSSDDSGWSDSEFDPDSGHDSNFVDMGKLFSMRCPIVKVQKKETVHGNASQRAGDSGHETSEAAMAVAEQENVARSVAEANKRWREIYEDVPSKTDKTSVKFAPESKLSSVHCIVAWNFAYRAARKGTWQQYAVDRCHFSKRTREVEAAVTYVFSDDHRQKMWNYIQNRTLQAA